MNLHVVTVIPTGKKRYAASHSEAVKIRMDLMAEMGLKRSAIDVAPVEVPTSKPDLLAWLNANG